VRSDHPQTSFAAVGARAAELMRDHRLESHHGDQSPLGRLEAADARVLLLGVDFAVTTAFHLAEYRLPDTPTRTYTCLVATPPGRRWVTYEDILLDASDFGRLGAEFERTGGAVRTGAVGSAWCRLFGMRDAVAFATTWLSRNRGPAAA
jgi:aminoglycoside 3-N-acetyltransferase